MSLRDELLREIRYDLSSDPIAREALLAGTNEAATKDIAAACHALNAYCRALQGALFKLADEVDALRAA